MIISVEALWTMPVIELIGAYDKAKRSYVERKFVGDTQRRDLDHVQPCDPDDVLSG
jgi:hypothetical protein